MAGTGTIAAVTLIIGASAALGVAQHQGWGAFGELGPIDSQFATCMPLLTSIGWSSGTRARSTAETRALVNWSKQAGRHGNTYASWHNAYNATVTCDIRSGYTAKCTVKGRPCPQKARIELDVMF